ncbi:hypothetical protein EON80_12580, partial [bacterium]
MRNSPPSRPTKLKDSIWDRFSPAAQATVARAQQLAVEQQSGCTGTAHLCLATLEEIDRNRGVFLLLQVSGVPINEARLYAQSALESAAPTGEPTEFTKGAIKVLQMADDESRSIDTRDVTVEHIFTACVRHQREPHVGEVLRPLGLDARQLRAHLRSQHNDRPFYAGNV